MLVHFHRRLEQLVKELERIKVPATSNRRANDPVCARHVAILFGTHVGNAAGQQVLLIGARTAKGLATTVYHSIAYQYFPPETQARIAAHMEKAGARATVAAPLAWLRFEMEPGADSKAHTDAPTLRLKLWPTGEDRLLARAHPHGRLVEWLA